jgi:hypothetical protein
MVRFLSQKKNRETKGQGMLHKRYSPGMNAGRGQKKVGSSEEDTFNVWLNNYLMELSQIRHFIK